jgi:hypothetical protein
MKPHDLLTDAVVQAPVEVVDGASCHLAYGKLAGVLVHVFSLPQLRSGCALDLEVKNAESGFLECHACFDSARERVVGKLSKLRYRIVISSETCTERWSNTLQEGIQRPHVPHDIIHHSQKDARHAEASPTHRATALRAEIFGSVTGYLAEATHQRTRQNQQCRSC